MQPVLDLDVILCNVIAVGTHFIYFHLLTLPLFLIYSTYFFSLQLPPCPPIPLLINHISWKGKLKHTGVDIAYFFPRCKLFTNNTEKVFLGSALWNQ